MTVCGKLIPNSFRLIAVNSVPDSSASKNGWNKIGEFPHAIKSNAKSCAIPTKPKDV